MKNKGKICATLSMISADGRHIEIHFTDKAEARATMDALESGVIPRQDLDRAVDRVLELRVRLGRPCVAGSQPGRVRPDAA